MIVCEPLPDGGLIAVFVEGVVLVARPEVSKYTVVSRPFCDCTLTVETETELA